MDTDHRDWVIRRWNMQRFQNAVADLRHSVEVLERDFEDELEKATRLLAEQKK